MVQHSEEILRYDWHYAILDEGHKIRNPDAKVFIYFFFPTYFNTV